VEDEEGEVADEGGNVADVLPQNRIANWPTTSTRKSTASRLTDISADSFRTAQASRRNRRKKSRSQSRRYSSIDDIQIHPASFRSDIIAASRLEDVESVSGTDTEVEEQAVAEDEAPATENSSLIKKDHRKDSAGQKSPSQSPAANGGPNWHTSHKHNQPKDTSKKSGHGHSHGDLNMRGVFLHVMGDALGNIGVITSALIIWLTSFSWRFYSDPAISLIITVIILCSAIPLCKAASRILLQAVPAGMSVDDIKADIVDLPGVISCHHFHVWQLSDTKLVASLHVQVEFDFKGEGSARYMQLARGIRECLHQYGIHSSTIQPEFCLDANHDHSVVVSEHGDDEHSGPSDHGTPKPKTVSKQASKANSMRDEPEACLLECEDGCGNGKQCCAPGHVDGQGEDGEGAGSHKHKH